ncbi:hypothetical protein P154DRAFT_624181 [Amniculicola lignicola CBS 123094]|uniref:Vacuolar import and degradation protein 21 n=1 Tax=Amniculicola lignicola CBS 123094 TaxID=1392246 RepID=A0A6A5W2M3_9PLEO|nr:hypothetical protein P154DRAFT_624181 [Amniculicola lignicola CBS 123094]
MSLDGLRDVFCREKKNEIANCELSRKRKLRELYNYTALLNAGQPPQLRDWFTGGFVADEPNETEQLFLDENDMAKGRKFDDTTLPYPLQHTPLPSTLPFPTAAKPLYTGFAKSSPSPAIALPPSLEDQLRAASASPSVPAQPLPSVEVPPQQDPIAVAKAATPVPREETSVKSEPNVEEPAFEEEEVDEDPEEAQQPSRAHTPPTREVLEEPVVEGVTPDGPSVNLKDVIPPTSEDATESPDAPHDTEDDAPKAPQVVHLPPQDVQEARLKETERNLEKVAEKQRNEDTKLAIPNLNAHADVVSSPSSTVGPYSQATPHAPHHSPDTSPDSESFRDHVPEPVQNGNTLGLSAQEPKDEHDRALQQQMQEARERAREMSPETPDPAKQIEAEQAIQLARDGKIHCSEAQRGVHALTDQAEVVAHEAEPDVEDHVESNPPQVSASDSLPTPTTTVPEPSSMDSESVDSVPTQPQQLASAGTEHPTPPADVDMEMEDTPLPVKVRKAEPQPQAQLSHPERTTTKVCSGAIRQKSVSDIIGEKSASRVVLTPRSSNMSSASTSPAHLQSRERKGKEVSTVVFAKQDANRPSKALQSYNEDYASLQGASQDSSRDYLQGLFNFQAHHPPRSVPLQELLASARKTVSTAGTLATIRETQDYKILKRVYQLQNANRWSLRQLQKSAEPPRPATHLDHVLLEMKWMQTDFKEERKWKRALAATFAEWCQEYVHSTPEVRASLRIRARIPKQHATMADEDMNDAPTPDLIPSGANETESESFADDEDFSALESNPPAGLFSLGWNDVVYKIDRTPASDLLMRELPFYQPTLEGSSDITSTSFCDPPILPVSKFVTGKMVSKVRGPPRKRSRYEYDSEDEPSSPPSRSGTSAEHSMPSTPGRRLFHRNDLPPEMTDVALFNSENKHVRDRLQASHHFRPPTEFPMPAVSFFECRNSSQWLWDEDQKLRSLVKEYTFNWSLVAQELALPSLFASGSGRRTPWECFERWVQLEGLPSEMSKTQYFRTYQTRLEQAQRTVLAQHQAQQQLLQQQAQQGQNVPTQPRRRTTQPIRVERRRENRHLAMIDAMRKLARKRESAAHKQAEAQKAAALRKAHEPVQPKTTMHTPQEFSRLKWEREEKMRQKAQMQHEMTIRQAMANAAAQRQAQMQGQPGMPNGVNQPQRTGTPSTNANVPTPLANTSSQPGLPNTNGMAGRVHPNHQAMPNFPNTNMNGMGMVSASGVPQAQMQATMQNAQRMPPPDQLRMAMQRGQLPPNMNQHQFQLQQQQINMAANNLAANNMSMGNGMPNANVMASMGGQNMNGNLSAPMNGMSGNASSSRVNQVNPQMQNTARPLSSGHMPHLLQLQNTIKTNNPDWSQEQVMKAASDQLNKVLARQRAMNAATGASGMASPQIGNNVYLQNGGMQNSPSPNAVQNYQAQLVQQQRMMSQQQRQQQQQQQQAGSPSLGNAALSRSATPGGQGLMQSPVGGQAQLSRGP